MKTTGFQWGCDARDLGCLAFDWKSMSDCLSYGLWQSRVVAVKVELPRFESEAAAVE